MIYTIRTLYCTIYEHLQYADTIQNFFYTIRYVSYDTYRVSYDTDNYALNHLLKYNLGLDTRHNQTNTMVTI